MEFRNFFELKSGSILFEDTDKNYFLLTDEQSLLVGAANDYNQSSNFSEQVIECRLITPSGLNLYQEKEDLPIVHRKIKELQPTLLIVK